MMVLKKTNVMQSEKKLALSFSFILKCQEHLQCMRAVDSHQEILTLWFNHIQYTHAIKFCNLVF